MKQGWEYKKLNEVCEKGSSNIVISKLTDNDGDYPLYGASGLVKHIDFYHQDKPYIGIVKDGAGVGRVNIYPAYSSLVGTMQYIFPKKDCLLNFIKYFLVKLDLSHCVSGATIPHIYFKDYGKDLIPVPSLKIQEKIVSELDKINELIRLKKEQLKDYDNLAQSIFYEMFGDPVENEKGWEVKELGQLCEVTSSKRVFINEVVDAGVPFIRGTELTALNKLVPGEKMHYTLFITQEHYERLKAITGVPKVGDLLIPSINADGIVWMVDTEEPLYFKDGRVLWIHVNHNHFNSIAIQKLMNILIKNIYASMGGATFAELKLFVLRNMKVPIPPQSVQNAFAEKIKRIDIQKLQVKKSITDLETSLPLACNIGLSNGNLGG